MLSCSSIGAKHSCPFCAFPAFTNDIADPLEYRIFRPRYSLGLRPRKIADFLKREGAAIKERPPTADAVSRVLELIYRRLRQDAELRDLLGGD
jgi:hypothetical protein